MTGEPNDAPGPMPAGFESLAAEADALGLPEGETEAGAPEAPAARTNAEVISGMIFLIRETVSELADLKTPRAMLTDSKIATLGNVWGEVLDGFGVRLGESMGKYGPVLMALGTTASIMAPIVVATRAEIATKDAPKAKAAEAPKAAPAAPPAEGEIRPTWQQ